MRQNVHSRHFSLEADPSAPPALLKDVLSVIRQHAPHSDISESDIEEFRLSPQEEFGADSIMGTVDGDRLVSIWVERTCGIWNDLIYDLMSQFGYHFVAHGYGKITTIAEMGLSTPEEELERNRARASRARLSK